MAALQFHSIADLFPLMSASDTEALAEDIRSNGLHEPIWLYEGKVLDGRNRLNACEMLDTEPSFQEYTGDNPRGFVVSMNLHRRHLTREQRDEVIHKLRAQGMTLRKIADAVGVGYGSVHRALESTYPNGQVEKLTGADGKERPTHYAPRQAETKNDAEDELFNSSELEAWEEKPRPIQYIPREIEVTNKHEEEDVDWKAFFSRPHVANNSGENEWYTPREYIERAVAVMGAIDLDPASTEIANTVVGAAQFYSTDNDGLTNEWQGRVFMNPPYASELIGKFINKLLASPGVTEAIVLVNNATETRWFQGLAERACAICFPAGRVKFWNPEKESAPLQGQAVLYIGDNSKSFLAQFCALGTVWHK